MSYGQGYVDAGAQYYKSQYRKRALRAAKQRAAQLGYHLVPISDAHTSGVSHGSEVLTASQYRLVHSLCGKPLTKKSA